MNDTLTGLLVTVMIGLTAFVCIGAWLFFRLDATLSSLGVN